MTANEAVSMGIAVVALVVAIVCYVQGRKYQ